MNDWRARGNLSFEFKTVNESQFLPFLKSLYWREIAKKVQDVFMKANIRLWRHRWKLSQQPRSPGSALFLNRRLSHSLIHEGTVFFLYCRLASKTERTPGFWYFYPQRMINQGKLWEIRQRSFPQFWFRQKAKAQSNKLVSSKQKFSVSQGMNFKAQKSDKKGNRSVFRFSAGSGCFQRIKLIVLSLWKKQFCKRFIFPLTGQTRCCYDEEVERKTLEREYDEREEKGWKNWWF